MPLEKGDLGARKEDVLTGSDGGFFLLDLEFHDLGRVLDDLGDVSPVARPDFAEYPFGDPDHTADKPIALRSNSVKGSPPTKRTKKYGPKRHRCYCTSRKAAGQA